MFKRALSSFVRTSYLRLKHNIQYLRTQNIKTTSKANVKQYKDTENRFAHDVLERSLKPYQIFSLKIEKEILPCNKSPPQTLEWILNPPESVDHLTGAEIVQQLKVFVRHFQSDSNSSISDSRFQPFTQLFCEATFKLSDEQLLETLRLLIALPDIESVRTSNYVEIWNAVDIECCQRVDNWDHDMLLKVCDAWYNLNLARINQFVKEALTKLGRKVKRLRPEQLVQVMFLCNLTRRALHEMFDFEENLIHCCEKMTLEELGVISMGFFKTQTPLKTPDLVEYLYRRVMAELNTVEDITLVSILKILRYSTKLTQADRAVQLMEALIFQVPRLSLLSCLHVVLLGSDMQCCNDELVELVLQRFSNDIENTRLKDLERICFAIGVFNSNSPSGIENELCSKILRTLKTRVDEIIKHPRCFVNCIHFLTLRGYYDTEMISAALDKNFIHHGYGKNALLGREIFQLDSFVQINLKNENYNGNVLLDNRRRTMGKMLTHYIPERDSRFKLSLADRVLLDIKDTTNRVIRLNTFKHVLPHYERPDVVFCYDRKQRKALPLSPTCPEDYSGIILTRERLVDAPNMEDIDTVVVAVAGWNNVVRDKDRLTGLFEMKLNQLKLLGHKPVVIYWYEWRNLETFADRLNFLRRKLSTVINL